MKLTYSVIAGLLGSAAARQCINQTIPVTISARQGVFNIDIPQTDDPVPAFTANLTQQGRNFTAVALSGYNTTSGTYQISTQFCTPDTGAGLAVQVLTHGIGFDKSYWDIPYNNYNYSFVNAAIARGYSTLTYDRLGIGNSSKGEPLNEIQAFIEIAATAQLSRMLRNGTFPGAGRAFLKVVHVGHSFGSAQTYGLVSMYPTISDAIVLTGFSMNSSFVAYFAAGANFVKANTFNTTRFGPANSSAPNAQNLTNGYLITGTPQADAYLFTQLNNSDPQLRMYASQTKQPVTLGELLTLGSGPKVNNFAGPVMVFTGQSDVPYCGGDCFATGNASLPSIPAAVQQNFPAVAASNFTAYIQPQTAHGLNIHYNATAGYDVIQDWLQSNFV